MYKTKCPICGYEPKRLSPKDIGFVRGNTERFKNKKFKLWKCPKCLSIISLEHIDFVDIYKDYPLNNRKLDIFAKGTLSNLLKRLISCGLKTEDKILDYGCGNGIFIDHLNSKGYKNVIGYDPYVKGFDKIPEKYEKFDWVIANDVIEHADNPFELIKDALTYLKEGGLMYVGTADSLPVEMDNLEPHVMRLHQPFHRVIITQASLIYIGVRLRLEPIKIYTRSYMDTLIPFANYRFLDEFSKALGHNMDKALDSSNSKIVFKKPWLLFYAFFGYFFPSAYEPAIVWKNKTN